MFRAPVWLNALNTLAPGAQPATCSPAEVVRPISRPASAGLSGFVQSMTVFPESDPQLCKTSRAADHGTANTIASAPCAASLTPAARPGAGAAEAESRTP